MAEQPEQPTIKEILAKYEINPKDEYDSRKILAAIGVLEDPHYSDPILMKTRSKALEVFQEYATTFIQGWLDDAKRGNSPTLRDNATNMTKDFTAKIPGLKIKTR